jgi:preprotein translocase subunit SecG
MYLLFVILMVIAALLMCFIVLIQNSKGGGLASGFSSSNAIMGVRKTTDFLEKATWGLAIFMVVMSIATAYVIPRSAVATDAVLEQAQKEQQTNPYNLPAGTAAPQSEAPATNAPATETPAPAAETPAPAAETPAPAAE